MDALPRSGTHSTVPWDFACPICQSALQGVSDGVRCARCNLVYPCSSGIWRFLPAEPRARYEQFLREYHIVREDQGWGQRDVGYFLALPQVSPDDVHRHIWRRRRESLRLLLEKVIEPTAARQHRPLRIADLGAGNCWLAYGLTKMGHQVAAIDLSDDETDGLGARRWYISEFERQNRTPFTSIQAEFDHLPLVEHAVDIALFNATLHYSTDCAVTLREALRILSPGGALVVMDSPVYRQASSGREMVRERESAFERTYGFRSNSMRAEHFLTTGRLEELAREVGLTWHTHSLVGGMTRVKGQWRRLLGRRELAEMPVVEGSRT